LNRIHTFNLSTPVSCVKEQWNHGLLDQQALIRQEPPDQHVKLNREGAAESIHFNTKRQQLVGYG
ncbi:hypothetical protein PCANC_28058, partial [Puccinia coronata f. sp. avenae]